MTYSNDLKSSILNCIKLKKYNNTQIMEIFGISKKTFYAIKNNSNKKVLNKNKRVTKINESIKTYIKNYVTRKINFSYMKLIQLVYKNYGIKISKSSIYDILKHKKIKKKRFIKDNTQLILIKGTNKLIFLRNK